MKDISNDNNNPFSGPLSTSI